MHIGIFRYKYYIYQAPFRGPKYRPVFPRKGMAETVHQKAESVHFIRKRVAENVH